MQELLLLGNTPRAPEPTGDVLFLFDPASLKDLVSDKVCITLANNAALDETNLIDKKPTIRLAQTNSQGLITLPTPINFEALEEWTVEWVSRPTAIGTAYVAELLLDVFTTTGYPIGCRWGDAGYGHRNQFNIGNWSNTVVAQPAVTKSQAANQDNRWAMVFKNKQLRIYHQGQLKLLAFGTSSSYGQNYVNKTQALPLVAKIYMGYFNSINSAWLGNMGRIRISNFARYLGNYTPVAF